MSANIFGYAGKLLRVNLTTGQIFTQKLNDENLRDYLGGTGYATKLLYDELRPGIDPLGPDNKLIFATGPLTSSVVPGGGSLEVCCKSPLTGCWGEARLGGDWGIELKKAGYDILIIEGRAKSSVKLIIKDDEVQIEEARNISGKKVLEKEEILRKSRNLEKFEILTIGPAGENLVLYSSVMLGHRAAGRVGVGAVMGSKKLLAVAVHGTNRIMPADREKFMLAVKKAHRIVRDNPETIGFQQFGTMGGMEICDKLGDLPTKNWQSNSWGEGGSIARHFYSKNQISNVACYKGCPIGCGRRVHVEGGPYKTPEHDGGEYESIGAFTAFILNEDVDAAVNATFLCNEYGIDTISAGASIAYLLECVEKGVLPGKKVDGLNLVWGNGEILPILVKKIALREGIGELLAMGVQRMAEKIGNGAEKFAVHVKGLEGPCHDPRSGKALAVSYGTGNRGMCHIHPVEAMAYDCGKVDFGLIDFGVPDPQTVDRWDEDGKGKITKVLQEGGTLPDILGTCKFFMYTGLGPKHYAEMLSGLLGREITGWDLLKIAERVINLQRLFNCREGFSKKEDILPERVREVPSFGEYRDQPRCAIRNYEKMLIEYYESRKWDIETGFPLIEKLDELGLEH